MALIAPTGNDEVDASAQTTSRDQLRQIVAGEGYCQQQELIARINFERNALENRLVLLIQESRHRELERSLRNAEAASRRVSIASERLRREAPPELHRRLAELETERKAARYELSENGRIVGDRIDYLRERIKTIERLPSMDSGQRYDLGRYRRELSERTSALEKAEEEIAEIERQMLEA